MGIRSLAALSAPFAGAVVLVGLVFTGEAVAAPIEPPPPTLTVSDSTVSIGESVVVSGAGWSRDVCGVGGVLSVDWEGYEQVPVQLVDGQFESEPFVVPENTDPGSYRIEWQCTVRGAQSGVVSVLVDRKPVITTSDSVVIVESSIPESTSPAVVPTTVPITIESTPQVAISPPVDVAAPSPTGRSIMLLERAMWTMTIAGLTLGSYVGVRRLMARHSEPASPDIRAQAYADGNPRLHYRPMEYSGPGVTVRIDIDPGQRVTTSKGKTQWIPHPTP